MSARASSCRRISSGLFEVDLVSGEVFKQGRRIPLQEQPFRVLTVLLEHPGQLVTREQLKTRLWPADTYVGFDEGLNTAIRKLRVVFGDTADNPRFIETVPRRGYRFIAPVTEMEEDEAAGPHQDTVAEAGKAGTEASPLRFRGHSAWVWVAAAAAGAVLVFVLVKEVPRARRHAAPTATPVKTLEKRETLAVLPFQNLSGDPRQEYFSDGLTEETITDLGQLSPTQLGVIARTSAMAYKHTDKTVGEIGHELGADYILEGSVRRENGRARVSAQLIRVSDQTHLWAESYDARNLKDLIDVENQIGRAIAEQVQANVEPQRAQRLAKMRPVSPEAYDLYLKGRFFWNQRTPTAVRESIELFKQATAADPDFAEAYSGLADAYNISNIVGAYSPKDSFPEAKAAATKAIELDPSLGEAHAALGMEKSHYEFDLAGARVEFLKAIELNPNSAYSHLFYSGAYLMPMGQRAEAVAEMRKALELDPLSLPINNFMGETYLLAGNYAASYRQFQHAIALDPNFPLPHLYLAGLLEVTGRFEEAIGEREKGDLLSGLKENEARERAGKLRTALESGGEKGYWKEHLAQDLVSMEKSGSGVDPSMVAEEYAEAGEKDQAFAWLVKAYEARAGQELTLLAVDPVWKNLHGDPRFADLLRRVGLPESAVR
jgi:TolB-like protein/DNA-binding winged helix-turn-helix (wHTH) protein